MADRKHERTHRDEEAVAEEEAAQERTESPHRLAGDGQDQHSAEGTPTASEFESHEEGSSLEGGEQVLPVLPLRNSVLFPGALMPLAVGRPKTLRLLNAIGSGGTIAVVSQRDKDVDDPGSEDLYWVGASARILKVLPEDENTLHVVVQGLDRVRCTEFVQSEPYILARVEDAPVEEEGEVETQALTRSLRQMANEVIELIPELPSGASELLNQIESPARLAYMIMTHLSVPVEEKQDILQEDNLEQTLRKALKVLSGQLEVLRVSQRINSEVKGEMNKNQREFFLRQQLRAIRKELGEDEEEEDIVEQLRERLLEADLPEEVQKVANKELSRLRSIQPTSPEHNVTRTYLEWLADLPWNTETEDHYDIQHAREILDRDHHGLEKVKKRILEFLAVNALRKEGSSPIICLIGPPGVGKTSLGRSVAEALGRKYQRVSLGGLRDEAEIRGHRRTYIGAMPGKFIQSIKRAGSKNPVMILDEIDKVGRDWRGDPTSALLEVLDPEQNTEFMDHYLDVPFDLSRVMFITTGNYQDGIPPTLRDRMEIIDVPGYTTQEKWHIAWKHLIPKQIREHGLTDEQIRITEDALQKIIINYTREAGVRTLERQIAAVCRSVAVDIVEEHRESRTVDPDAVADILGPEVYLPDAAERTELPGIATGMAWTEAGGDILFNEATMLPGGDGKMQLTGSLGDVMKESAELALSYLRSKARQFGIDPKYFKEYDFHVHIPQGSVPKDGPSAGLTMLTALTSLMTNIRTRGDVSMTGEITLRGYVLPVGGVKEKVIAAHRSGIRHVILPERNRKDLPDVHESVRNELEFHFVERMDEVLHIALEHWPPEAQHGARSAEVGIA